MKETEKSEESNSNVFQAAAEFAYSVFNDAMGTKIDALATKIQHTDAVREEVEEEEEEDDFTGDSESSSDNSTLSSSDDESTISESVPSMIVPSANFKMKPPRYIASSEHSPASVATIPPLGGTPPMEEKPHETFNPSTVSIQRSKSSRSIGSRSKRYVGRDSSPSKSRKSAGKPRPQKREGRPARRTVSNKDSRSEKSMPQRRNRSLSKGRVVRRVQPPNSNPESGRRPSSTTSKREKEAAAISNPFNWRKSKSMHSKSNKREKNPKERRSRSKSKARQKEESSARSLRKKNEAPRTPKASKRSPSKTKRKIKTVVVSDGQKVAEIRS